MQLNEMRMEKGGVACLGIQMRSIWKIKGNGMIVIIT